MRTLLIRVAQLAGIAAVSAYLLSIVDLDEMGDTLAEADMGLVALAIALNVPVIALFAVRSHFVLRKLGYGVPPAVGVPASIIGNVAGALTPASTGEILRALALRSNADVAARDGATLVLFERAMSLYLLALTTGAAAAIVLLPATAAVGGVAATIAAALAPIPVARAVHSRWPDRGPSMHHGRLVRGTRDIATRLSGLTSDARLVVPWDAATLGVFATVTVQYWLLARALSDAIGPAEAWTAFGASQLAAIASLLPLGLGVSDASLAGLLDRFGMTLEGGAAVAVLARLASTLPLVVAALASYLYLGERRLRDAPDPERDAAPTLPGRTGSG